MLLGDFRLIDRSKNHSFNILYIGEVYDMRVESYVLKSVMYDMRVELYALFLC